jgi:hypothetical protein
MPAPQHNPPQQLQTQQIYIPNDLVGCIIGKGGSKINEIRHMSASQIKIMEPGAVGVGMNGNPAPTGGEGERLVVITGQPANIQMAVQLLYHVRFSLLLPFVVDVSVATGTRKAKATACADGCGVSRMKGWICLWIVFRMLHSYATFCMILCVCDLPRTMWTLKWGSFGHIRC